MNKNLIKYALVIFVSAFFSTNCANAQNISNKEQMKNKSPTNNTDLSTDEGVLAALQKMIDAKNAVSTGDKKLNTKRQTASRLEAKDICIKRVKETAKIIVIGFFRTDAGCHFDGAFIDSQYYEREVSDVSKIALAALDWEKASQKERENLAKIWVERGLLVFASLSNQSLAAVSINGEIKVTASSKYPPGVTSRTVTKSFIFDKDGGLISGKDY
jgi:hypothetical protein